MQISVPDPILQTYLFLAILLGALALSIRRGAGHSGGVNTTQELKGFAILAIVLAHVGYYLSTDTRFLFPLSVLAGTGVDIFLFVSGYGLTASALSHDLGIVAFYRRRLSKIYVPLWITLTCLFLADLFILHKTYGWEYIAHSYFGWFPHANLFSDVDSPLWYLTLILFYYLLFPLLFSKTRAPLTAAALYAATIALLWWTPEALKENMPLYELHFMAFPLGVLAAWGVTKYGPVGRIRSDLLYYPLMSVLAMAVAYFAINSGVGTDPLREESVSMLTTLLIIALFVIKRHRIGVFYILGVYSFGVYLLHWPLMARYDIFFAYLPASLALAAYFVLFVALGWLLEVAVRAVSRR